VPGILPVDEVKEASKRLDEAIAVAIEAGWVLPSGRDDFSFVDRFARGKRLLFLGESPHYEGAIREVELGIAERCAELWGYRALALEQLYSLWPYFEASSSGAPGSSAAMGLIAAAGTKVAAQSKAIVEAIGDFNARRDPGEGLLLTAVDIDHAINHTKALSEAYFAYLASKSRSEEARAELSAAGARLRGRHSSAEVEAYLGELGRLFRRHRSSFLPADLEEIEFSLGLERASIRYQLADPAASGAREVEELRGAYFRKTIARAYAKAQARRGGLICVVGGAHATLRDFDRGDYVTGRVSEARYFASEYSPSAGAVASVGIVKLGPGGAYGGDCLTRLAAAELGRPGAEGERGILLDLGAVKDAIQGALRDVPSAAARGELRKALRESGFSAFFAGSEPKLDAIFFAR
jgi:hypothetical protein